MAGKRVCLGYGELEGKCREKAGTPWGPYWCPRCDRLRLDTISAQFEAIGAQFEAIGNRFEDMKRSNVF